MPTAVEAAIVEMKDMLSKFNQAAAGMDSFAAFASQHHASGEVTHLVANLRQSDRVIIRELQDGIEALQKLLDDGYPAFPKVSLKQSVILELQAERDAIKANLVKESASVDMAFDQFIIDAGVTQGKMTFGTPVSKT